MEKPPNVTPLTERKDKRKKLASASTSAGESFVQIVEAVTSASTGTGTDCGKLQNQESSTNVSKLCFTIPSVILLPYFN